jgi:uncharacterized lipoprotein NlpE involved in copper resistance
MWIAINFSIYKGIITIASNSYVETKSDEVLTVKKGIIFIAIIVGLLMTGCNAQPSAKGAEIDTEKFIADTKEIVALAEEVYNTGREFTATEESDINEYEANYGDFEETRTKSTVNSALLVVADARRLDGVDDTFASDLRYVNQLIEDMEKGAPQE